MSLRKVIKRNAKAGLQGNFGRAIVIMLIVLAVTVALGMLNNAVMSLLGFEPSDYTYNVLSNQITQDIIINGQLSGDITQDISGEIATISGGWQLSLYSAVSSLVMLFITAPLALGVTNWYLELTDGRREGVGSVFWPFESKAFGRSVWAAVNVGIRSWLAMLLIVGVPVFAIATVLGVAYSNSSEALISVIAVLTVLVAIVCFVLAVVYVMRFALVNMLLCRKYYMTVRQAIKASRRYTKGHRWELLGFILSFIPWFLLCVFIVPLLYVVPYFTMTMTMYCRYLYEDGLHKEGKLDTSDPEKIIIDDISPDKVDFRQPGEQYYYPPQAWGDKAPKKPAQPEPPKDDGYADL